MKIRVYDNKGETFDRFTVIVDHGKVKDFYAMSENALGFNQYCGSSDDPRPCAEGSHLGNRVYWPNVPQSIKNAINAWL